VPDASIVIPEGLLNFALVPTPSANAVVPDFPARVETTPKGEIFLITDCPNSPTKIVPCTSTTILPGVVNRAFVPMSSIYPIVPLPAIVVTVTIGEGSSPA